MSPMGLAGLSPFHPISSDLGAMYSPLVSVEVVLLLLVDVIIHCLVARGIPLVVQLEMDVIR